jgi:hypothetical protein
MNYLELALKVRREIERESAESRNAATTECEISEISDQSTTWPDDDAYSLRLRATLREICERDYPAGMPVWLRQRSPRLYAELVERLPNDLKRIWSARGPLKDFERVLARWSEAHSAACALYRAEKRAESDR